MNPKIKITNACQQDWHQMQTVDGCKFCTSCQKQVIDFMAMDNHEIIQKMKQEKEVCARMSASQLAAINRQLNAAPTAAPK